jgi:gliding motility-associated protein GldL
MHWPGAGPMLIAGLGTEAVIFFFSAFEPLHEEDDWSLVYPQLAGLEPNDPKVKSSTSVSIFDEKLLASTKNAPELFEKLTKGLSSLGETASMLGTSSSQMSKITDAVTATNGYVQSLNTASKSVGELSDVYKKNATEVGTSTGTFKQSIEGLNFSVEGLSESYGKVSKSVTEGGAQIAKAYKSLSDQLTVTVDFSQVNKGNQSYNEKLSLLNKNLSALNAIFELQLEGGLDNMMNDLKGGVEEAKKYKDGIASLAQRVQALNTVYGNMLAAMNVAK